ncbi:MAG TPA: flagellar basal body rod protein FlgB [Spirochaetota bacterium]|nr:flagellar basal body rod protein FlgB [Spirochaetota bacterium]HOM38943.1 flagellar basal body rod protein FlgB [Spirochaetota bacterium]HPQ49201.1 flagellar basal body rod protein FlgB [Spirochaetota bacterium]
MFEMTQNILEMTLNASVLRWNVLSNNIANATTPNFKRSDVTFSSELKRALDSNSSPYPFEAARTNSKHIPFFEKIDYTSVKPKIYTEFYTSTQNNGNNVDMEYEMGEASKTLLLYDAASNMITRNYNRINMLLR